MFRRKRIRKNPNRSDSIVFEKEGNIALKNGYIRLKDNLLYYKNIDNNVISITSSLNSESKTTTISNLAVCLGLSFKKVIVIDLDFHKPRVHRHFEIKNEDGIVDYLDNLVNFEEVIKKTRFENVFIINRGNSVNNTSLYLTSLKLKELILKLKKEFDFVLLDTPPVLLTSDYFHITKLSDGLIFLMAHAKTPKSSIKEALKLLKQNNINIIGAVFTFYNPHKCLKSDLKINDYTY